LEANYTSQYSLQCKYLIDSDSKLFWEKLKKKKYWHTIVFGALLPQVVPSFRPILVSFLLIFLGAFAALTLI